MACDLKTETTPLKMTIKDAKPPATSFLYFSAAIATLIAFASGIAYAWASPILPKLNKDDEYNPLGRKTTPLEDSWIASILNVGSILGVIISGFMADKIGRKKTILALAIPTALSLVILAFADSIPFYYFARILMGLGAGSGFTILPVYLSEIAEDHNRGTLTCLNSVSVGLGLLFAFSVGPFLTIRDFCLVSLVPLVIFFPVFLIWIPETPHYLALTGNEAGLKSSLLKLRNKTSSEVSKEAEDIMKRVEETSRIKGGFGDLFKNKSSRRAVLIAASLITFQQCAGINVVLSYMQSIFEATGSGLAPETSTIIVGVVQVFAIMASSSVVDRLGRRILFLCSSVGSCVSLVLLGLYFHLKINGFDISAISWLPVSSLLIFIVSFNMGLSVLPWLVMAELFPSSVKAAGSIFTGIVCFTNCFLITFFFPTLSIWLGMDLSFWVFAIVCVFCTIFVYTMLPETKGKSVEEIQILLEGRRKSTR